MHKNTTFELRKCMQGNYMQILSKVRTPCIREFMHGSYAHETYISRPFTALERGGPLNIF